MEVTGYLPRSGPMAAQLWSGAAAGGTGVPLMAGADGGGVWRLVAVVYVGEGGGDLVVWCV